MRRLCLAACATLAACGPTDQPDDNADTDLATEPAYLFVNRVRTLASRTNYVSILPSLEPTDIDLDAALEVPGTSRFAALDGKVYVFEGETGEVSRYRATDDLALVEEARFSMANEGVSSFGTALAFISPTRAYYIDREQAQVVVFDPTEMVLSGSFSVPGLVRDDYPLTLVSSPAVVGDEVVVPVGWRTNDQSEAVFATAILVLSATEDRVVGVFEDSRCGPGLSGFVHEGAFHVLGDWDAGAYDAFLPDPDDERIAACLLRYTPGSDGFDPDYLLDMTEVTGRPLANGAFGTVDGRIVARVWDAEDSPAEVVSTLTDPAQWFGLEVWRWAVVDMRTEETTILSSLDLSGTSFNPSVVDDRFYVPVIDEETQSSTYVEIDGVETRDSVRATGDIITAGRLR